MAKLKQHLKAKDTVITLYGQEHNGINDNIEYKRTLRKLLTD